MKAAKYAVIAILLSVVLAASAQANAYAVGTVGFLRDLCDENLNKDPLIGCLMYFQGFAEGHSFGRIEVLGNTGNVEELKKLFESNRNKYVSVCIPEGVKLGQMREVFVKEANAHPERLHEMTGPFLGETLLRYFPCKAKP